jgi:choline dehydrogenase-like flavoprotein
MIIDTRSLPLDEEIVTQVCIVGAGPAGITLAREFINQKFEVCLLESGGIELEKDIQSLCDGVFVGDFYPDLKHTRRRQFGGTSHCWEGPNRHNESGFRCLPLDPIDFEKRDWIPYSGWPFAKIDLDPFYERAHKVCKLGPYDYKTENWENSRAVRLPFKSDRVTTTMSQYSPKYPFTHEYREEIDRAHNIKILLYANVTEIETDPTTQSVTRLCVSNFKNRKFWVKAKIIVLATGGLENARLLLASKQHNYSGLGNEYDLVGRFFMDRPIVSSTLIPFSPKLFDQTALYDIYLSKNNAPVMARVMLTENTMRQEQLMNNGAQLFPRPLEYQSKATLALRDLFLNSKAKRSFKDISTLLRTAIGGGDYILAAGFWAVIRSLPNLRRGDWSYLPYEKKRFSLFEIFYQLEQAPNPNNRVMLSSERDALGQNKTELHWKLNPIDIDNACHVQEIWAEEFAKANLGELQFAKKGEPLKYENPAMHHHMGTTRMHQDPKQGVVDENCKVHGISNLFIAGSSVFPTSGYANPTLTIIALTIKLADRIKILMN